MAGKTTQMKFAREYNDANGLNALFIREPGETDFGKLMRHIVLEDRSSKLGPEEEVLLYLADRIHTIRNVVEPALQEGRLVIGDRGDESMQAYQSARGKISLDRIKEISELMLPEWYKRPDAVILLLISSAVKRERLIARAKQRELDKIEERDETFFNNVSTTYHGMVGLDHVRPVDADKSPEEVWDQVRPLIFGPEHA